MFSQRTSAEMPRGKELTEIEVRRVWFLRGTGMSIRRIAKEIRRSKTAIENVIKRGVDGSVQKRSGAKSKVSHRDRRRIIRLATLQKMSAAEIAHHFKGQISRSTITRVLNSCDFTKYVKMNRKPALTDKHKKERRDIVRKWIKDNVDWKNVIFSDEKRFNLDGPDGLNSYWHDLRKAKDIRWSRRFKGGSLMMWGAVSANGKTDLVLVPKTMNTEMYLKILDVQLLAYCAPLGGSNFIFQQDGASCHTSRAAKKWFEKQNINVLPWPANSPDLNIIENVWSYLVHKVYEKGRQYNSLEELENNIYAAWDSIDPNYLKELVASMPERMVQCLTVKGGPTTY